MSQEFVRLWMTQIWQIAAVAVVVALVVRVAARKRPHLAHAMWVLVLIKCVTPPLWGHSLGVFSQIQAYLVNDEDSRQALSRGSKLSPSDSRPATGIISATQGSSPLPSQIARPSNEGSTKPGDARTTAESSTTDLSSSEYPGTEQSTSGWGQSEAEPPTDATNPHSGSQEPGGVVSHLPQLILATVLIGSVITLLIMIIRCVRCLRVIHRYRTTDFDEPLRERIQYLAKQLRVRQVPRIVVSEVLLGPAVLGVLRYTIVLPKCLLNAESGKRKAEESQKAPSTGLSATFSPASGGEGTEFRNPLSAFGSPLSHLDLILAHELLHIRRGDLRTGMLQDSGRGRYLIMITPEHIILPENEWPQAVPADAQ